MNWTKPKELGRELLVTVRRAQASIEVVMDAALTTFLPTRTQTSRVVVRIINPRHGIRALGLVEQHRTEK
jgi:hypothetical protein